MFYNVITFRQTQSVSFSQKIIIIRREIFMFAALKINTNTTLDMKLKRNINFKLILFCDNTG